jgi:hypothetical protein
MSAASYLCLCFVPALLWASLVCPVRAADGTSTPGTKTESSVLAGEPAKSSNIVPFVTAVVVPNPAEPTMIAPVNFEKGVDWLGLTRGSLTFLGVQHTFRLYTEPGTRDGLKGPFLENYARSVGNPHGWADGDEFYVNYVGHPMEGAVAGFIWMQNDRTYRSAEFGKSAQYWKSRLCAAGFAWAFSTQFEIGPVSEASIGAIQASFPQQGFVDHVITPVVGLGWMIGEDAIDRYVIKRIEALTPNSYVRLMARCWLNPTRSFANMMQFRLPWARETRPDVDLYIPAYDHVYASTLSHPTPRRPSPADYAVAAPFEFALNFQPQRLAGGGTSAACLGGGATTGFRLASSWQLITQVGGCKMMGLEKNLSGDSLTYMAGPRWVSRIHGPWSGYLQLLAGGNKVSEERMYPQLKQLLEQAAISGNAPPPTHDEYTKTTETNGFAVSAGDGIHYNINPALTLQVAELSYRRSWTSPLWGRDYSGGVQWSSGLMLRMGTW